ncbi:hypothetical protein [Crocosphaera chwakensis]|uniref:Uncharacterized protein n=1 Tax=Crocosphaera chwakensis CCY0110 TaxID=391612 RepID=A3IY44_9CHRO|nr:hypothetical protein [Crocosphaera chwakensis]EAZ88620.1 hypothetical protein CY0110_31485 [Crocosphaera chwakensis CCY0110]
MSYTQIQRLECQGIPTIEYRAEPDEIPIPQRIQFDFVPRFPYDQYAYSEPRYVFCEEVVLASQWHECQKNQDDFFDIYETYRISTLDLVEYTMTGDRLYEAPYWRFGIRGVKGKHEISWFQEDELISLAEINSEDQEF